MREWWLTHILNLIGWKQDLSKRDNGLVAYKSENGCLVVGPSLYMHLNYIQDFGSWDFIGSHVFAN